jgi:hypothetical protein
MYQPAHFVESRPEVLQRLIREHPFGLLVTDGASGLAANGVPFLLEPDPAGGPGVLRAHVARANPVWKEARSDRDSLVVFQGPQGYISPAWYPSKAEHGKVVPTWNYMMVQARGRLRAIARMQLRARHGEGVATHRHRPSGHGHGSAHEWLSDGRKSNHTDGRQKQDAADALCRGRPHSRDPGSRPTAWWTRSALDLGPASLRRAETPDASHRLHTYRQGIG